jgi:chorismate mutase
MIKLKMTSKAGWQGPEHIPPEPPGSPVFHGAWQGPERVDPEWLDAKVFDEQALWTAAEDLALYRANGSMYPRGVEAMTAIKPMLEMPDEPIAQQQFTLIVESAIDFDESEDALPRDQQADQAVSRAKVLAADFTSEHPTATPEDSHWLSTFLTRLQKGQEALSEFFIQRMQIGFIDDRIVEDFAKLRIAVSRIEWAMFVLGLELEDQSREDVMLKQWLAWGEEQGIDESAVRELLQLRLSYSKRLQRQRRQEREQRAQRFSGSIAQNVNVEAIYETSSE